MQLSYYDWNYQKTGGWSVCLLLPAVIFLKERIPNSPHFKRRHRLSIGPNQPNKKKKEEKIWQDILFKLKSVNLKRNVLIKLCELDVNLQHVKVVKILHKLRTNLNAIGLYCHQEHNQLCYDYIKKKVPHLLYLLRLSYFLKSIGAEIKHDHTIWNAVSPHWV